MSDLYILAGPSGCGNTFGSYRKALVPEGKFAVVRDGEYANGGHGPSSEDGRLYSSHKAAAEAVRRLVGDSQLVRLSPPAVLPVQPVPCEPHGVEG